MVWRKDGKHLGSEHSTGNPNRARGCSFSYTNRQAANKCIDSTHWGSLLVCISVSWVGTCIRVSERYRLFYLALSSAYLQENLPLQMPVCSEHRFVMGHCILRTNDGSKYELVYRSVTR